MIKIFYGKIVLLISLLQFSSSSFFFLLFFYSIFPAFVYKFASSLSIISLKTSLTKEYTKNKTKRLLFLTVCAKQNKNKNYYVETIQHIYAHVFFWYFNFIFIFLFIGSSFSQPLPKNLFAKSNVLRHTHLTVGSWYNFVGKWCNCCCWLWWFQFTKYVTLIICGRCRSSGNKGKYAPEMEMEIL